MISRMDKPNIKRRKTYQLRLTRFEILHLRDLMSVCLPPEGKQTLSGALATLENRQLIESLLWKKVSAACAEAQLPTGEDAPDYVIAPTGITPLGVFQLASDPNGPEQDDDDGDEEDVSDEESVLASLFKGKNKK
jgi:hypothetical protein